MYRLAAAQKVPKLHLKLRRKRVLKCEVSVPEDRAGMYCASYLVQGAAVKEAQAGEGTTVRGFRRVMLHSPGPLPQMEGSKSQGSGRLVRGTSTGTAQT